MLSCYPQLNTLISIKENERFELSRGLTHLTVFKTVPFSQTWVILHIVRNTAFQRLL